MTRKPLVKAASSLAIVALLGVSCAGQQERPQGGEPAETQTTEAPAAQPDYQATYATVRDAYAHMFDTGDALAGAIATQKKLGDIKAGASDTRLTLDRLLAEHALLAVFAMQKGFEGAPDFMAAAGALDKNSDDLGAVVTKVYGEEAGNAFLKQWKDHIRMFVDYTKATAAGDDAAREKALNELSQYRKSFSEFMGKATGAPASAVAELLQEHVTQLTKALDTYKAKDYAGTYEQVWMGYDHMYDTGDALAGAIAKQKNLGSIDAGAADLRVTLDKLLAEHAGLAIFAMQKGAQGKPDFTAIAGALDKNTDALSAAVGSVYGQEAQSAFDKQWTDHIRMFVDFTKATAGGDEAARKKALDELAQYRGSFSSFMSQATGAPQAAVADALQAHVDQLTSALDEFVGKKK